MHIFQERSSLPHFHSHSMLTHAFQISRTMRPLHFAEESENRFGDWQCQVEAAEHQLCYPNVTEPWDCGKGWERWYVSILSIQAWRDKAVCSGSWQERGHLTNVCLKCCAQQISCIFPCSPSRSVPASACLGDAQASVWWWGNRTVLLLEP